MKIGHILASVAALTSSACAEIFFEDWSAKDVQIGETYTIKWNTDSDALERLIQLALIRLSDDPAVYWSVVEDLVFEVITAKPGGSFEWTVDSSLETGGGYALWLISEPKRQYPWWRDRHQTEDQVPWFNITADKSGMIHDDELKLL